LAECLRQGDHDLLGGFRRGIRDIFRREKKKSVRARPIDNRCRDRDKFFAIEIREKSSADKITSINTAERWPAGNRRTILAHAQFGFAICRMNISAPGILRGMCAPKCVDQQT
jgi:hypothetical protein